MHELPAMFMTWFMLTYKLTKIRRKIYHSAHKEDLWKNIKAFQH